MSHHTGLHLAQSLLAEATRRFPPPRQKPHTLSLMDSGLLRLSVFTEDRAHDFILDSGDMERTPAALLDQYEIRVVSAKSTARGDVPVRGAISNEEEDATGRFTVLALGDVVQRFRFVAPGKFTMGSPETEAGRFDDEGQHEVELTRGYWMADTPVTQALWTAVMGENPSRFQGADRPVERVSWEDCQRFIAKLNGLVPGLDARLPTEAEWERACRGGTTGATWVGELNLDRNETRATVLDPIAWYYGNSPESTQPVGTKDPNPLGLYDMLGNVWEWCGDWLGTYEAGSVVDPSGPQLGSDRVIRGGSWVSDARLVRAAVRYAIDPALRRVFLGLRLARGHQV